MTIGILYDGEYPHLCMGTLVVVLDGVTWRFPGSPMMSGGACYENGETATGPWSIDEWPDGFPEEAKEAVLEKIDSEVQWGCCGGCI